MALGGFRQVVESRIFWKYLCLVLALLLLGTYLVADQEVQSGEFMANLFYAVVTSLIVSLFYDLGSRKDTAELVQQERDSFAATLDKKIFSTVDVAFLTDMEIRSLAQRVTRNDRFMEEISEQLLGGDGQAFYRTWLKPLISNEVLRSGIVENRLSAIPGRTDAYELSFRQRFKALGAKQKYTLVVTCDNDLYNELSTAGLSFDEIIGTSSEEWPTIDDQFQSLSMIMYRSGAGRRETAVATRTEIDTIELSRRVGQELAGRQVKAFDFELRSDPSWVYEYKYEVVNRITDPYYYWTAHNPMFVEKLVLDYYGIKPLIGRVSANCILGVAANDPHHDEVLGQYTVTTDSLLWPGQGAMLVWRALPIMNE